MLGVIPVATTRVPKKWGTALYSLGIFFLMFCFQKTYQSGIFFIDYRYTYPNIAIVFLLAVVFTAAYYLRYRDLVTVGRVTHYMSVAVVISYIIYRWLFRDWVLNHFEYITDDYHFIFCAVCLMAVLVTAGVARLSVKTGSIGFNDFYTHFVKGAVWLFVLCFLFLFFLNRSQGEMEYRDANLIPFRGELNVLFHLGDSLTADFHLVGNIVFFGLFGLLVASCVRSHKIIIGWALPVAVSIMLEIYQYLSCHGDPDIDDVIANTLGAILGVAAYQIVSKYLLSKERDAV